MSYIDILDTDHGRKISKLARESCTYSSYYHYWRESLFERVMRLFVWEGTENKENPKFSIEPKEIEAPLILAGHGGITKVKSNLLSMFGSFYGPTYYYDEWKYYTVRSPLYSGKRTIDKDVVVINNSATRYPVYTLIHHYATLLAHAEVTLNSQMINARDSGGVPIAKTEKQKQSINEYQAKLFNGQYGIVTDTGMLGIEYAGSDRKTAQDIMRIMEVREKLIKSFYSDIGVRSAFEKRNNTVMAEVEADTSLLLLNIADMLHQREKGCEKVNKMFGTNWSVHIAEEIDYSVENERVQFDTGTEVHSINEEGEVERSGGMEKR